MLLHFLVVLQARNLSHIVLFQPTYTRTQYCMVVSFNRVRLETEKVINLQVQTVSDMSVWLLLYILPEIGNGSQLDSKNRLTMSRDPRYTSTICQFDSCTDSSNLRIRYPSANRLVARRHHHQVYSTRGVLVRSLYSREASSSSWSSFRRNTRALTITLRDNYQLFYLRTSNS